MFKAIVLLSLISYSSLSFAERLVCGGDSLSVRDLNERITALQFGQSEDFITRYLNGLRPPTEIPSTLTVLDPDSSRYEEAQNHLAQSQANSLIAIERAKEDPEIMSRYRRNCRLDDRSDEEILAQGVEVARIVIVSSEGRRFFSSYMTSYRPEFVGIDVQEFEQFTLETLAEFSEDESLDYIEIQHNHPRVDGFSGVDTNYAHTVSRSLRVKVRIIAWLQLDDKVAELTSRFYINGQRQDDAGDLTL